MDEQETKFAILTRGNAPGWQMAGITPATEQAEGFTVLCLHSEHE